MGIEVRVGDAVIHGRQSGRARVGQVRRLHRRGFAGEHEQAIAAGVHGQVHEDVDVVLANQIGQRYVAHAAGHSPGGSGSIERVADRVLPAQVAVAVHFDALAVMVGKQRHQQPTDRMIPQIPADVSDP